jgi:hypothetical protein
VTLAHVGGVPIEEWLTPLLAMGGGLAVALRSSIRRAAIRRSPVGDRTGARASR